MNLWIILGTSKFLQSPNLSSQAKPFAAKNLLNLSKLIKRVVENKLVEKQQDFHLPMNQI